MKELTIFENKNTRVYINQCHRNFKWEKRKRTTNIYAVRKDDTTGYAELLGIIKFDSRWRQYVLFPEPNTKWSAGCKEAIAKFEKQITSKWRKSLINERKR